MKKIIITLLALAAFCTAGAFTIKNDSAYGRVVRPESGKLLKIAGADAYTNAVYIAANMSDTQIAAIVTEIPAVEIAQAAKPGRAADRATGEPLHSY
ncbi:hypothetical protein OH491_13505 [Termitidicoccus mucosus]|uniref:hypothetical protein n=1 Tax=Termitidicoccus mucosus TaxID=1184151 RepID=UPI0031831927